MKVQFKRLNPDAVLPKFAHPGDAGMDVYSTEEAIIPPHGWTTIKTGLAVVLPPNSEMQVRPRSGYAAKVGIFACLGTVDEKYRGEIFVTMFSMCAEPIHVLKGAKLCQFVVTHRPDVEVEEIQEIDTDTERGTNGQGSTGM